ncbi:MAG TPA: ring-cleaving dioxygenase [Bacillales bacterium]|nr:ring-cleaving dioxygenase [Bacillales bacterium]
MFKTKGIHHITAIVGDPQENVDFYANVLGLRLVKKTVNFDDPATYHLYFGDKTGQPGTILTFFPWPGAHRGRIGSGMVGVIPFVVPEGALDFWEKRLAQFNVSVQKGSRFGEEFLQFKDPHGLNLELVAREEGAKSDWISDGITSNTAIKGFAGAVLFTGAPYQTIELLEELMGLENIGQEGDYLRLRGEAEIGNVIDIKLTANPRGIMGAGTVHHIAWRTPDGDTQLEWQSHLFNNGFRTTEVKDRQYFNSIYFQERGGILFEIATDVPGFDRDEPVESLGQDLKLPPWLESRRERIKSLLPAIKV